MQNEGVCHPLYREEIHTLLCNEKESLSSLYRRETLSPLCITEGHSVLLCRDVTSLSSVQRRSLPPQHIAEGHSILCGEKTLSPLYGALSSE